MRMSNDIFDRNIDAMRKWYPDFADAVIAEKENFKSEFEIVNTTSWDEKPIVIVNKDDKEVYLQGKRNVKTPLELWKERLGEIHKYAPIVLVGLGIGNYLKTIVDATDETVNVIAYEPSKDLFFNMLENIDLVTEIESRPIAFIVEGVNENEFAPVINQLITTETMEFLKVETHPNYSILYPDKVRSVLEKIFRLTDGILVNYRSGNMFSSVIAKNQLSNMKYLCEGYNTKQLATAIPHDGVAILVAAGPSLSKNINELKKAKNKAFILAVDSALKPLISAGIMPDAYITIDAQKPLNRVDMPEIKRIPLIASSTANSDVLKQQTGKILMCDDGYALAKMAYYAAGKELPGISTGGSVACNGFSLLYRIGFDTIILVGQDLAYTNNKAYADGVVYDKAPKVNTENMIKVKGNYEEEVPTLANLKIYLEWFEDYIKGIKTRRNVRVINATAGGAFIEGTELMNLEDAINENCKKEINFEELIENMKPDITEQERNKMIEYLHKIPDDLESIRKNAKMLYREYHKIYNQGKSGRIDSKAYINTLKKIKKYTKKCDSIIAYQLITSSMPSAEYIIRSESLYENDSLEEEAIAIGKQGMIYSKMIQQCAKILYEYAGDTLYKLE